VVAPSVLLHARSTKLAGRMTTIAEGNGAEFLPLPNFSRPRSNLISCFIAYLCHHAVSVRAGTKHTTVAAPCMAASCAFAIHLEISLPYGGFMKTNLIVPGLEQTIVLPREVSRTLRVGVCRTRIEGKAELLVEHVE